MRVCPPLTADAATRCRDGRAAGNLQSNAKARPRAETVPRASWRDLRYWEGSGSIVRTARRPRPPDTRAVPNAKAAKGTMQ